jgi:hypothetical protein
MTGPGNGDELQVIGSGAIAAHVVGMDPPPSEHIPQDLYFEPAIFGANEQVLQVAMPVLGIERSNCIKEGAADYQSGAEGDDLTLGCRTSRGLL